VVLSTLAFMSEVSNAAVTLAGEQVDVRRAVELVGQILVGSVDARTTLEGFLVVLMSVPTFVSRPSVLRPSETSRAKGVRGRSDTVATKAGLTSQRTKNCRGGT